MGSGKGLESDGEAEEEEEEAFEGVEGEDEWEEVVSRRTARARTRSLPPPLSPPSSGDGVDPGRRV
eukprot:6976412-Lingulodinium_polyedra.AAC.1